MIVECSRDLVDGDPMCAECREGQRTSPRRQWVVGQPLYDQDDELDLQSLRLD
jgi:hypothetical protein